MASDRKVSLLCSLKVCSTLQDVRLGLALPASSLCLWLNDGGILQVRLFHFLTGKLHLVFDEGLRLYSDLQQVRLGLLQTATNFTYDLQKNPQLPNMEFGRRLSVEKELEKVSALSLANARETTPLSMW